MELADLRARFPVLARLAWLNAGTNGPLPLTAAEAARAEVAREVTDGRGRAHFERRFMLQDELRAALAARLGAAPANVALATCTSEGIGRVLAGLELGPGDEIVSSDCEHPGLLGPLQAARQRGVAVRLVPLAGVADAVGPRTTLVAVSHVAWTTGALAPVDALAQLDVPVLYDGAQALGAIDTDVAALACDAYAAPGQKWLCGSEGTGALYLSGALSERMRCLAPSYVSFASTTEGIDAPLHADARRHDAPVFAAAAIAATLASSRLLDDAGGRERSLDLAAALADRLTERGRVVAPRGRSTLVAWHADDAEAEVARCSEAGVVVRFIPGYGLVRASVGAWTSEDDLEQLLAAIG